MEHYFLFDFDETCYLVKYKGEDIGDEIDKAIVAYNYEDDTEYSDIVEDVMTLMGVKWEIIPCRRYLF